MKACRMLAVWLMAATGGAHACLSADDAPVRWIVPNTTGSSYDVYARLLEPALETRLGAPILIENRAGAGGIVAARLIAGAAPDGRTIGILNGTGILIAALTGHAGDIDLVNDLEILGRASTVVHVWVVKADGPLRNLDDLRRVARSRPIVMAVRDVASSSYLSLVAGSNLLAIPHALVAGYVSNREARMAVLRGEADVASMNFESGADMLAHGELAAVLQMTDAPIVDDDRLVGVPLLAGPHGIIATDPARARVAAILVRVLGANRLFVAPRGLSRARSDCLREAIGATFADEALRAPLATVATRIDYVDGPIATRDTAAASAALAELAPYLGRGAGDE
jgi:tripartite-type tricarboxylate transporter receptor subunit TctC